MSEPDDHVARIQDAWRRERPDVDVAPQGIIGRLHRLGGHLDDELATVYARHGLGFGEFDVLATLRRAGPPYERAPGEIAQHTMVTTGAVTKRIDRLVAAGLVERRRAEHDGRRRVVALTADGLRVIDTAFTEHMANERRLVDQLAPEDQAALERILRRWIAAYE